MFKFLIKGIYEKQWDLVQKVFPDIKRKRLFNNTYFCQNPNARNFFERYYFIRVKKIVRVVNILTILILK